MAEAVGLLVLAGGVIGMGQARHKDDAGLLAERLNGNGHTGGRAAGDHDGAVLFDHRAGGGAGCIRLRLGVAGHELDFAAQNPGAVERVGREGRHHAAIAATVKVFDGQLKRAQFVCTFICIRAGLGHVEAQRHVAVAGRIREAGMAAC